MIKEKYAGEKEIKDKIKELFSYRKLTDLLHMAQLDKDKRFVAKLTELQYQIYLLDAYLESEWSLEKDKLKTHWNLIKHALGELVPAPGKLQPLLAEIHEYERIELNCRKLKWPTREPFKKFYTIKSCDVRLNRHLIYQTRPELQDIWVEKAWVYYDMITEVNDDIADLLEDLNTYNGNRFLISILRKGSYKTVVRYREQLASITAAAKKYFKKNIAEGEHKKLFTWTLERAAETSELLESTMAKHDPAIYTSSILLGRMK